MKIFAKTKVHYAWFILIMCCMMFGSCMGIYSNCTGLYTAPLLEDLGWKYTTVTVIGISSTVSRIYASGIATKIFKRFPLKLVLSISVIVLYGAAWLKCIMHSVFFYTLINILIGLSGAFILYIPVPMLINNWFEEKKDTALGIAMLCSGLLAAVFSPIFSTMIQNHGWRYACAANAITGLAIALPPVLLFAVRTPEEIGLKPYGWKEPEPIKSASSPSEYFKNGEHPDFDTRYSRKEKKQLFVTSLCLAMFISVIAGLPTRLAHFGATSYVGAATGALLFSASQIGNMLSKLIMGPLCDKIGPRRTYVTSVSLVFVSFMIFFMMPQSIILLYAAAFMTGISCGNNMMIYPAAVRTYSRGDEYTAYISKVSIGMTLFGTPFGLLISALYDITGTYTLIFAVHALLDLICIFLTLKMFPEKTSS